MPKKPWRLIRKKLHEDPDMRVGKAGISDGVVQEAKRLLAKKGIIKVKFLKNIAQTKADAKALAEELAKRANAKVGKVIGKVAILYVEGLGDDKGKA